MSKLTTLLETSLSYASVMGIKTDIHLTKSNYSWLGSMYVIVFDLRRGERTSNNKIYV